MSLCISINIPIANNHHRRNKFTIIILTTKLNLCSKITCAI